MENINALEFRYNDGGRDKYFKAKHVNDCVTRAIAVVTSRDYKEVYKEAADFLGYSPRNGIRHNDTRKLVEHFGGKWNALMTIGSGCKHHLKEGEIPMQGNIICSLSGHLTAVVNGVINDTYDCSRNGRRCVYGYYQF